MDEDEKFRGWDFFLEGGKPAVHIINSWPEDALKVVSKKAIQAKQWTHVLFTYDGSSKAKGVTIYLDGRQQDVEETYGQTPKHDSLQSAVQDWAAQEW